MNAVKNNVKTIIVSLIVMTFNNFCMDKPTLPGPTFFKNLPNPEQGYNRDTIIFILSNLDYPKLEYTAELINHLASNYPKFNIFLNKPNNFMELVHNLSKRFHCSDMQVCQALNKIDQALKQIKQQNKLNFKIAHQRTPALVSTIDPNFTINTPEGIITPLITAITNNNWIMAYNLLQAGVNPNEGKYNGDTPLILCIRKDKQVFVYKLLKNGADPYLPGDSGLPLTIAKLNGNQKIIQLLENGDQ